MSPTPMKNQDKDSVICLRKQKLTYLNYQGVSHSHFYYWEIKNLEQKLIFIEPSLTFHMLRQCSECLTCIDLLSIHKSSLHIFFQENKIHRKAEKTSQILHIQAVKEMGFKCKESGTRIQLLSHAVPYYTKPSHCHQSSPLEQNNTSMFSLTALQISEFGSQLSSRFSFVQIGQHWFNQCLFIHPGFPIIILITHCSIKTMCLEFKSLLCIWLPSAEQLRAISFIDLVIALFLKRSGSHTWVLINLVSMFAPIESEIGQMKSPGYINVETEGRPPLLSGQLLSFSSKCMA